MKVFVFKRKDGGVTCFTPPLQYQGGYFVEDKEKPIYGEVDDLENPNISEEDDLGAPIVELVNDKNKPIYSEVDDKEAPIMSKSINPEEKQIIIGYQKKKVLVGYDKKIEVTSYNKKQIVSYPKKEVIVGYQQRELTLGECKCPKEFQDLDCILIDAKDLFPKDPTPEDHGEMIYFDGQCKAENLKRDRAWEKVLMPPSVIRRKHFLKIKSKIENEFSKDSFDPAVVLRLKNELEKKEHKIFPSSRSVDECEIDLFWYQKALENLDQRVEEGEKDKPEVRKKLKQKIKDLKK